MVVSRQFPRALYGPETLENKSKFPKLWVTLVIISILQKTRIQISSLRMRNKDHRIQNKDSSFLVSEVML